MELSFHFSFSDNRWLDLVQTIERERNNANKYSLNRGHNLVNNEVRSFSSPPSVGIEVACGLGSFQFMGNVVESCGYYQIIPKFDVMMA